MMTFQVLLKTGAVTYVNAERYHVGPLGNLNMEDGFGNISKQFATGTWADVAVVNPTNPGTAVQNAYQPIFTLDVNVRGP